VTSRAFAGGALLLGALLLASCSPLAGQQLGVLGGVVVDEITGQPLPGAVISLPRIGRSVVARENGRFLLEGLPVGAVDVRFEASGYMTVVEQVELSAVHFVQVRLTPVQAVLDTVLVIAGRRPPTRGGGDVVVRKDEEPWRSVLDLLEDQVPGVVVRRDGGNVGTGAAIYFRGVTSFQVSAAPQVYLDGIRLDGRTGARSLHVLDMISADEVARVRVVRGASGPVGLGAAGANGAIVIETHGGTNAPGN
jgi:hypothetical protein